VPNREKQNKLMGVIDALNRYMGRDTITFAVQGINGKMETQAGKIFALL
jgi:hypothetical protein